MLKFGKMNKNEHKLIQIINEVDESISDCAVHRSVMYIFFIVEFWFYLESIELRPIILAYLMNNIHPHRNMFRSVSDNNTYHGHKSKFKCVIFFTKIRRKSNKIQNDQKFYFPILTNITVRVHLY